MWDLILESVRTLIIALIFFALYRIGKQRGLHEQPGWNFILFGWLLILVGSLFDVTDNFDELNRFVIIGDTAAEAFIEKFVGFLLGYVFLFIGFIMWLPAGVKKIHDIKNDFISIVSHELRTPITSIYGSLRLANADTNLDEVPDNLRQILDIALRNSERLTRLVNDILDLQRIEADSMVLNIQPHDVIQMCHSAIRNNLSSASSYRIDFALHTQLENLVVLVDAERFYQIMDNLLSNAAKFSHPGGTVDITVETMNQHCRIAIRDHGRGIDEELLPKIFTPFAQAQHFSPQMQRGSGLGLAITDRLLKLMNGQISCETAKDEGSVFYIHLPLAI